MWRKGGRYFFYKKAGLQNQSVLYTQVRAQTCVCTYIWHVQALPLPSHPSPSPFPYQSPQDSVTGEPRVLVDPNTLREDGTAALSSVHLSDDANTLAYMVALSGSDWQTIKLMCVRACVVCVACVACVSRLRTDVCRPSLLLPAAGDTT